MARSRVFFSRFLSLFDRTESYSPSVKIRRCPYCNTYRDGRNMLAEHSTGCLIHYLAQSYASPLSLSRSLGPVPSSVLWTRSTIRLPSTPRTTSHQRRWSQEPTRSFLPPLRMEPLPPARTWLLLLPRSLLIR